MTPDETKEDDSLPALVRAARGAFVQTIREQLEDVEIYDFPRNGTYIVNGLYKGQHAGELFQEIGPREGVRSRLLQALVERDFVEPGSGEARFGLDDLALTEKGHRAAQACARGVSAVTEELASTLSAEEFSGFRAGLLALRDIKERNEEHAALEHEHGHAHPHPH